MTLNYYFRCKLSHSAGSQYNWTVALLFFDFRFKHDWSRAGNSAILTNAPEMQGHEDAGDQGNGDAMPDVGAQQCVCIDDRPAKQGEAHVVVRRHAKERAKWALRS